jgi:hypothetical protein
MLSLLGCSQEWVLYGEEADLASLRSEAMNVSEGIAQMTGVVTVQGEIGEVCDVGCWFYLVDESELLFVRRDLKTTFVIPEDSTGREAVVSGQLGGEGETLELAATTVGILE